MPQLDLHCKISEDAFSRVVFLVRLLTGSVLVYTSLGGLLYYREFLYNAAALGWPLPAPVGLSLLAGQLILALLLVLGWFTRLTCALSIVCVSAAGVVFFAADVNKIYVALVVLLVTALLTPACLGPGKISLDYKHALRRATQELRG